ncbi:MAG: DNA repair protein RecO [Acetobacteraceae bacterium]|nr:DNA repair protein RecO [Acetobacteraceae bacterium]
MEWEAPAVLLDVRPFGEGDGIATVLTAEHGAYRGLARGAQSRSRAATWQRGNLVQARWVARIADQLGSLTAELVHPSAALALDDAWSLAILSAACAVAEGALGEREPHPLAFDGLVRVLAQLPQGMSVLADLVRWEAALLGELGYGLDFGCCAVTGATNDLRYVSPRTGRAVSQAGAGSYQARLLPLPDFLLGDGAGAPTAWRDGLRLTGHFLARDAFGLQHRPLPPARIALYHRVCDLAAEPAHA